jgi:AcrR family transcriptional regulator
MCPRKYRLGKREVEIQATRDAILSAARDLFQEFGYHRTSIEDVARRADVSPATIYYQFGTKPGLLDAVLASLFDPPEIHDRMSDGAELVDPYGVVATAVHGACRVWMNDPDLFRALLGLGDVDPSLRSVIDQREESRRRALDAVARRLSGQGALAIGYDERRAADVLSMLTSFASFDHLVTRRGFCEVDAIEAIIGLASTLVDPDHSRRRHNGVQSNPITATA